LNIELKLGGGKKRVLFVKQHQRFRPAHLTL